MKGVTCGNELRITTWLCFFPNILVFTQVVFLHSFPVLVFSQHHYRPEQAALTVFREKINSKNLLWANVSAPNSRAS